MFSILPSFFSSKKDTQSSDDDNERESGAGEGAEEYGDMAAGNKGRPQGVPQMMLSEQQLDMLFPAVRVQIDTRQCELLKNRQFFSYIESRFSVSVREDRIKMCCFLSGTSVKVMAAQQEIMTEVSNFMNAETKTYVENKSHSGEKDGDPSSTNTKVKHSNGGKIPPWSGLLTLSSDCWQYIKEIHSRALTNIQQECKVEITETTSIEFCSRKKDNTMTTQAEHILGELLNSVGDLKKMTLRGIYDTKVLKSYMPDISVNVIFQTEGELLHVIGPEQSLKKLRIFLGDASAKPLQPVLDVATSLVSSGIPPSHAQQDDVEMMETGDSNNKYTGESSTAVPPPGFGRGKVIDQLLVSQQNKTPGVGASKHVRESNQGTVGARPKQPKTSETEGKDVAGAENVDKSKMSQIDIITLATDAASAEFSEDSDDGDTFKHLNKPRESTNTGTYGGKINDTMFCGFTHKKNNQHIILCTADITNMKVDAIVNAANEHLKHMGGVAKAISDAAGPGLQEESTKIMNKRKTLLDVTETEITCGHDLPSKHVIHVVGPRWYDYKVKEKKKAMSDLKKSVGNVLRKAGQHECETIALPAISSGHFGMPWEHVAECIVDGVLNDIKASKLKTVYLVDLSRDLLAMMHERILAVKSYEDMSEQNLDQYRRLLGQKEHTLLKNQSGKQRPSNISGRAENFSEGGDAKNRSSNQMDTSASKGGRHRSPPGNLLVTRSSDKRLEHRPDGSGQNSYAGEYQSKEEGRKVDTDGASNMAITVHNKGSAAVSRDGNDSPGAGVPSSAKHTRFDAPEDNTDDRCAICLDAVTKPFTLPKCKHVFCTECINLAFEYKPICPSCGLSYGKRVGNQPQNGKMTVRYDASGLPGYDKFGSIVINYSFPSGMQTKEHPTPGQRYDSTHRTAYLPDTVEGNQVLKLLQKAFDARLTFTVGTSVTTGKEAQVTWNDIHHKTNRQGGPARFGYPDPTYLSRVKEELAAKGIK